MCNKNIFWKAGAILAASALCLCLSCSGIEALRLGAESTPLDAVLKQKDLSTETRKLLELSRDIASFSAQRYGLEKEAASLRYLPGKAESLAWRLTVVEAHSLDSARSSCYRERTAAEGAAREAGEKGRSAFVEPWNSLGYLGLRPSPLFEAQASWPYARLVEWINFELFSAACAKSKDQAVREDFPAFAAEIATREYLQAKLTAASPLLGNYLSEKRDDATFAALFPDFRSRIAGLYSQRPLPADWKERRDFLSRTWLQDFRDKYPSRFLTNKYLDFGRSDVSDAEIAAWHSSSGDQAAWGRRLQDAGGDLAALLRQVEGR